jgi:hypothetical protein
MNHSQPTLGLAIARLRAAGVPSPPGVRDGVGGGGAEVRGWVEAVGWWAGGVGEVEGYASTLNPKPQTLTPRPETLNSKP